MSAIFTLLWLFCTVMFILGMINPQKALIPYAKQGRKQVFYVWFLAGLLCFIIAIATTPDSKIEDNSRQPAEEVVTNEEAIPETTKETTLEPTIEPTDATTPEPTEEPTIEVTPEPTMDLTSETLSLLIENFGGLGTVTIDREAETYNIIPTDPAFSDSLIYLAAGYDETIDAWKTMVDSFTSMSSSVYSTTGYSIVLLNPENTENTLLWVYNGVVMYDFTDDLG